MDVTVTIETHKRKENFVFDIKWEAFLLGMFRQIENVDTQFLHALEKLHNDIDAILEMTPEERDYIDK